MLFNNKKVLLEFINKKHEIIIVLVYEIISNPEPELIENFNEIINLISLEINTFFNISKFGKKFKDLINQSNSTSLDLEKDILPIKKENDNYNNILDELKFKINQMGLESKNLEYDDSLLKYNWNDDETKNIYWKINNLYSEINSFIKKTDGFNSLSLEKNKELINQLIALLKSLNQQVEVFKLCVFLVDNLFNYNDSTLENQMYPLAQIFKNLIKNNEILNKRIKENRETLNKFSNKIKEIQENWISIKLNNTIPIYTGTKPRFRNKEEFDAKTQNKEEFDAKTQDIEKNHYVGKNRKYLIDFYRVLGNEIKKVDSQIDYDFSELFKKELKLLDEIISPWDEIDVDRFKNKKAYFNYELIEKFEAGIALTNSEINELWNIYLEQWEMTDTILTIKLNEIDSKIEELKKRTTTIEEKEQVKNKIEQLKKAKVTLKEKYDEGIKKLKKPIDKLEKISVTPNSDNKDKLLCSDTSFNKEKINDKYLLCAISEENPDLSNTTDSIEKNGYSNLNCKI